MLTLRAKNSSLHNKQEADKVIGSMDLSTGVVEAPTYQPTKSLSELKKQLFDNLATVLKDFDTPEMKQFISENCWQKGLFEKCFDSDFQAEAVPLVTNENNEGKYFAANKLDPVLGGTDRTLKVAKSFI